MTIAHNPLSVGFESDVFRGSMTGIGNYCFHLIKALMEQEIAPSFYEFSHFACRPFGVEHLARIEQIQGKHAESQELTFGASIARKASRTLRLKLAQAPTARRLYRELQAARFKTLPKNTSLKLFHAFRYVPFAELDVPILPVVYDLSFVRFPDAHPKDRLRQLEKLPKVIEGAKVVHTISEFSKTEIAYVYGCRPEKIIVAPPAASSIFRPLGQPITERTIVEFGLNYKSFFLAVGTLEPRKNLRTLIMAYAQLPITERRRCPMVIVGNGGWGELELPQVTAELTSSGTLRFLRSISDAELRSLYEGARALLFPSIYEGFGMPVVEALACGTAVVHSQNTCMDEITRGHAVTVPATDVGSWASALCELLDASVSSDNQLDDRFALAKAFSWSKSAEIVANAYKIAF